MANINIEGTSFKVMDNNRAIATGTYSASAIEDVIGKGDIFGYDVKAIIVRGYGIPTEEIRQIAKMYGVEFKDMRG